MRFLALFSLLAAGCGSEWTTCGKDNGYCGYSEAYHDTDGDGYDDVVFMGDDCDDLDAATHPGAPTICDPVEYGRPVDRNCDGVDDQLACDLDGDGVTQDGGDCNDLDAGMSPAREELCDPSFPADNDCDGLGDSTDPDCQADTGSDTASGPTDTADIPDTGSDTGTDTGN